MGRSRRSLTHVRALALVAAVLLAAPIVRADGLLYKPGDIIVPVTTGSGMSLTASILVVAPDTSQATPIATGNLLEPTELHAIALADNGDILVLQKMGTGGNVVRVDGSSGDQSPVTSSTDYASSANIARFGDRLVFGESNTLIGLDLGTGDSAVIASDGFLNPNVSQSILSVRPDSTSMVLVGNLSFLLRISLDTGAQSLVADFNAGGYYDTETTDQGILVLTFAGLVLLAPDQDPTFVANIQSGNTFGILRDGTVVVGDGAQLYRVQTGSAPTLLYTPADPSTVLGGLLVAPGAVPEPAGGQLVALLALAALARAPSGRKLAAFVQTVHL